MLKSMEPHIYDAFKSRNDHTPSLDQLFEILRHEVGERIESLEIDGEPLDRELIGFALELRVKNQVTYNGTISAQLTKEWIETRCKLPKRLDPKNGERGFDGKVWFRTNEEIPGRCGSMELLFRPSMMHLGGGGYSTWKGPWNEFGHQLEKHNVGIPWEQKGRLAAYCYDIHFFFTDIPGLDHMDVMLKLQDRQWEDKYYFEWQKDGQEGLDKAQLDRLQLLQEQQSS